MRKGLTKKQLEVRKRYVTASDSYKIWLNKWGNSYSVWLEKQKDYVPEPPTDAMQLGLNAEPMFLNYIPKPNGGAVSKQVWATRGCMGATVDIRIHWFPATNQEFIRIQPNECKVVIYDTRTAENEWGEPGSEDVPAEYYMQLQHQCWVCDDKESRFLCDDGVIWALLAGRGVCRYPIKHDREFTDRLAAANADWHKKHVVEGRPPELSEESAMDHAATLLPMLQRSKALQPSGEMKLPAKLGKPIITMLEQARAAKAMSEKIEEVCKTRLEALRGNCGIVYAGNKTAWWQTRARRSIDTKKLQEDYPEVYDKVAEILQYTVITTKGTEGDE